MQRKSVASSSSVAACSGRDGAELPPYTVVFELTDLSRGRQSLDALETTNANDEDGGQNSIRAVHSAPNTSSHRQINTLRCGLGSRHPAVWELWDQRQRLLISGFAATVLSKARLITLDELSLYRVPIAEHDDTPLDPFSGAVVAVFSLLYNSLRGIGEVATEFETIALELDKFGRKHCVTVVSHDRIGSRSWKGTKRFLCATLRSPMTVTLALADGAHYLPRHWHDRTLRRRTEISGVGTGIIAGCKEILLGTYDGIAGLIVQPYLDARRDGVLGAFKGFGKGLASSPAKFLAAMSGPVGYPLKGLDVEIQKLFSRRRTENVVSAVVAQGERDYQQANEAERLDVIERWTALQEHKLQVA